MLIALLASTFVLGQSAAPVRRPSDPRIFEIRTYFAAPGRLDDLNARFRNHTCNLFRKHGMTNIGYWTPIANEQERLIYVLAFPDAAAREKAWAEFGADPEWKKVVAETEAQGRIVTRVTSVLLKASDFSPRIGRSFAAEPRVFELRTYTAAAGKLEALLSRFRDHTVGLFRKAGFGQVAYWQPIDTAAGADDTLVYILAHKSEDAARKGWERFSQMPEWQKVRAESEKDGPLLARSPESIMMRATDYSTIR